MLRANYTTPLIRDLTLEITRRCPLKCFICSSNGGAPCEVEYSLSELKNIIDEAALLGCNHVSLSGGEPLLYQNITDLCAYIKDKRMELTIYTCGNIGNKSTITPLSQKLLEQLKETGGNNLVFSIHGGSEQMHDDVTTREGSFKNLLTSIIVSRKLNITSELHFVPLLVNYQSLDQIVSLAEKYCISQVSLLRFVPQGRGSSLKGFVELNTEETHELEENIRTIQRTSNVNIRIGAHYSCLGIDKTRCTAGIKKATILPDGYVIPCPSMKGLWEKTDQNNIRKNTLSAIWNDAAVFLESRAFLERIAATPCGNCPNFDLCRGGCPTQRMLTYGDVENGPDPLCKMKEVWHKSPLMNKLKRGNALDVYTSIR